MSFAGKKHSLKTKMKMSKSMKEAHVDFFGEKNPMFGRRHSKETKKKISEKCKGMKASAETRKKLSNAHKGLCKGKKHPNWNGGKFKLPDGYINVYKPEHPYSSSRGYVREHRLIMEKILGRYLYPHEIPHHKNEIRDDNRRENLRLFKSKGKHMAFHNHLRAKK